MFGVELWNYFSFEIVGIKGFLNIVGVKDLLVDEFIECVFVV